MNRTLDHLCYFSCLALSIALIEMGNPALAFDMYCASTMFMGE